MDYIGTLMRMLLFAPYAKLIACVADRHFCLQRFNRAPDEGRIMLSWGSKEGHEAGVAGVDYDFVTAYDLNVLADRAAVEGVYLDDAHIPLHVWAPPRVEETNGDGAYAAICEDAVNGQFCARILLPGRLQIEWFYPECSWPYEEQLRATLQAAIFRVCIVALEVLEHEAAMRETANILKNSR